MLKANWMLSTLLFTGIIIGSLPTGLTQTTKAHTNSFKSWQEIFQEFFSKKKDNEPSVTAGSATSRSLGILCAIAPLEQNTNAEVWSDRPLFVWLGAAQQIEVRLHDRQEAVWRQTISPQARRILYGGEALQPGNTYDWVILNQENNIIDSHSFQVMELQKRDRIKTRLKILAGELKEQGATVEETALQRANYFAQQQLWSDVLQEVYRLENPSATLTEIIQTIPTQTCNRASAQSSF